MKVHSIISNTISEEILQTGHLSIRFLADGFSLLLEDRNFHPVILNRFSDDLSVSKTSILAACTDWLNRHTLFDNFTGEVSIIADSLSSILVPKELFSKANTRSYLESATQIAPASSVEYKKIQNRPFVCVYSIPNSYKSLASSFKGTVRILPSSTIMLSMADQVNAADHQRGFALIEVQQNALTVLMIKKDKVQLYNQLKISQSKDLVYHILNTLKQLDFKMEKSPLFFAGNLGQNELQNLKKYIRNIHPLSYYIKDIDKASIQEHILLAEASKCE